MTEARPRILPILALAVVVTTAVTGLRLYGELQDWDPKFWNKEPGGGGALVGISWLVLLFGFGFGRRLARAGVRPANTARAIWLPLVGFLIPVATIMVCMKVLELPFETTFVAFCSAAVAGSVLAVVAWPALFAVNLVYGIVARGTVVAVTYWAVSKGWNVHYAKPAPEAPPMQGDELAMALSVAQVAFWIPFTVLIGGLFGGLGAAVTRRPPQG